jgi:hypothetical protein
MNTPIHRLLDWLLRHDQALTNARAAATELSRRRVEREEVEIYLDERRRRVTKSA